MKNISRIGKIARLPHSIREQLNLKLLDHQPAKKILPWLNSLPEVKAILADLDHHPITKQNLSDWKQGGHRDWLLQYHAANFLLDSSSLPSATPEPPRDDQPDLTHRASPPQTQPNILPLPRAEGRGEGKGTVQTITDPHASNGCPAFSSPSLAHKLLLWTQLQYVSMARSIDAESDPQRKWNSLRQFANDISRLRRSGLADDYLQIQRDWLALSQSNTADAKEKQFWKWTDRPDIHKKLFPDRRKGISPEALYEMETKFCLMGDGPGPDIAELMAEVRIAKKLLEIRKVQEAQARAKADPDFDPNRPLPDTKVRLAGMPFEELFPTVPEKPLTQTHPELDDFTEESDGDPSNADAAASDPSQSKSHHQSLSSHGSSGDATSASEPPHSDNPQPEPRIAPPAHDQNITQHPTTPLLQSEVSPDQSRPVQPNPTTPPPDPDATM